MNLTAFALLTATFVGPKFDELPIQPYALSNDGTTVVGYLQQGPIGGNGKRTPCYWTQSKGVQRLDLGMFDYGEAMNSSADGSVIVGIVESGERRWAAVWKRGKTIRIVASYESAFSLLGFAPDVSGDGTWVVGSSNRRPFKWSEATGLQIFNPLDPVHKAGSTERISLDGSTVIGSSSRGINAKAKEMAELLPSIKNIRGVEAFEACFWRDANPIGIVSLKNIPWSTAEGVSADGSTIVGNAMADDGEYPFIWTKAMGYQHLDDYHRASTLVSGISTDGRFIWGTNYGIGDDRFYEVVWVEGKKMKFSDFLVERGVSNAKSWTGLYVRGISPGARVMIGDGWNPKGKYVPWIIRL